ncbi:hypothetical protein AB6A40_003611 [Gnathostoma spinigerum]|uniref:RING-type domain-containing protein n=1 Tax=Gnathostoma spinigerum TaxID=75299 RepID=A0ABD6ECB5_9BILA
MHCQPRGQRSARYQPQTVQCSHHHYRLTTAVRLPSFSSTRQGQSLCTFFCDDNIADVTFNPCGHHVACSSCIGYINLKRCPMCYQMIKVARNLKGEVVKIGVNKLGKEKLIKTLSQISPTEKTSRKVLKEEEVKKIVKEAYENARKAAQEEKNKIVQDLRNKLEQLEMEIYCSICMERRCGVVFQCGHTTCEDCGKVDRLTVCHICRQPIKTRIKIYS